MTERINLTNSQQLLQRAQRVIPGGVNSPVRAFGAVGGTPIFFKRGSGAWVYDVDGNRYVDYVGSWGPLILGHAHPRVLQAVCDASAYGLSFGAPTATEVELAELISALLPSMEMVRMVSSGTEATMSALRLARAYTGRDKIVKFDSCYHGHNDSLLVNAGSGVLTLGIAGSAGIPDATLVNTIVEPYNDLAAIQDIFVAYGNEIAAIIIEPIAANNNLILPVPGFLSGLRKLCSDYGSVLIFDEVITGFRVGLGGAQGLYDVVPDLTCLGKIIGGGMPVGAFGGRRELMQLVAPLGPVYQAGTLSGNPVAMAAGLATLRVLLEGDPYTQLAQTSAAVMRLFAECAAKYNIAITTQAAYGLFGFRFTRDHDHALFKNFFWNMLKRHIYLAPSAFEVGFVSLAHDQAALHTTELAVQASFAALAELCDTTAVHNVPDNITTT